MRVPLIHGLPPRTPGLTEIRSCQFIAGILHRLVRDPPASTVLGHRREGGRPRPTQHGRKRLQKACRRQTCLVFIVYRASELARKYPPKCRLWADHRLHTVCKHIRHESRITNHESPITNHQSLITSSPIHHSLPQVRRVPPAHHQTRRLRMVRTAYPAHASAPFCGCPWPTQVA